MDLRQILCVEAPGLGGMGIHYVNMERVMYPGINQMEPEILLYAPSDNGLKLVGVDDVCHWST